MALHAQLEGHELQRSEAHERLGDAAMQNAQPERAKEAKEGGEGEEGEGEEETPKEDTEGGDEKPEEKEEVRLRVRG